MRKDGGKRFIKPVGNPNDARGLYAAMRRYLEHLAVKGYTEQGRWGAERYIRDFIDWADARSVTHPQHVTRSVLERYQRWLHHYRKKDGAPLSIASQRSKLVPLRGFFKWLTRSGELEANPASEMELPRRMRRLPASVLTADEVERVLALADTASPIGLRDRAMMEVLYSTGMRRMELARLAQTDIDFERAVVLIRQGKGNKDRLIPIGSRALSWVRHYLDQARPQLAWNAQDNILFLGLYGESLSATWLSTTIAQYVERAKLGKHGGCHLFRHTMATLMLEGGADIRFIQAMLGHAELSTTQIYTQVAIRQLQQVHATTHPGACSRVRAVPTLPDGLDPQPASENAAEALLAALDAEADEADGDDSSLLH
ncbi:integrase/recombinase XerD [Paucimonas lemoignei]|uniref:Integrase/recombinase XerD n=1 Tax=Paucimonas lemoignei TaxID=29443 RepID=A0A4R3HY12_PAULE|nr:site-specific tyrosine recombinase XerC [Paucimonas lemoignei]TCS37744.1 integrase/recombinase XerD [Paucimonas lemoignei]